MGLRLHESTPGFPVLPQPGPLTSYMGPELKPSALGKSSGGPKGSKIPRISFGIHCITDDGTVDSIHIHYCRDKAIYVYIYHIYKI